MAAGWSITVIRRMSFQYTGPMQRVLTAELQHRIERSVAQFPELTGKKITVGLTRSADGTAEAEHMIIRLNIRQRKAVSYFTIGHELTHLLQSGGLRVVPIGEIPCDVWTLARCDLFLDDRPSYLCSHTGGSSGALIVLTLAPAARINASN